jgi:hypothetical protein
MNGNVFMRYPKEHLLERKQTPTRVNNPPKKLSTRGKIEPLGFQRVGHENGCHGVTWLGHLVLPFGTRKC